MVTTSPAENEPEGAARPEPFEPPSGHTERGFPIVGIGASAGGLAAFEAFFSGIPPDAETGMAFVLVQHLAPDHKSLLSDLLKRYTRMQVLEVADGMTVQPNCAYIIPPNCDMAFLNGTLQLLEPAAPRGQRLPIDFFFRSLAQDQRKRAIGIVLSGTGSDGTLGVRAIKGEGGMAMAQDPGSTEYDGMPSSAIATGLVDYVLPAAAMPARLIAYVAHSFGMLSQPVSRPVPQAQDSLKKIFLLLRSQTNHDFSQYKRNTILRRIERRMAIHRVDRSEAYVRYLQQTPAEVEALFRDLLIGVTSFFRDPAAFEALQQQIIPRLFADKSQGALIRVWVPGCSTGEEAYSIAILLQEHAETLKQNFRLQVFATDIDRKAIEQARTGIYPDSIVADVSAERLERFFTREEGSSVYRIHKTTRDIVIFSEQDLIKDPPFSKLALISCRNLLIYMGAELQKKLIPLFHYSLHTGGVLFLGTSETIGESVDLFTPLDRKAKLYLRKGDGHATHRPGVARFLPPLSEEAFALRAADKPAGETKLPMRELTERVLLQYVPAAALVNRRGDILYLHGRTGQYLEPAPGEPGMNILRMAREGLRQELIVALQKAGASGDPIRQWGLPVESNGAFITVNLTVQSVSARVGPAVPELFLVTFENAPAPEPQQPGKITAQVSSQQATGETIDVDARVLALQEALRTKEEYLKTSNEELETSNEELKSTNEEMQSVNEELQSTNEQLETSKEELQSVNEELATVNSELQNRVTELSRSNNDLNNLLAGTGIGTVFVDHHLRIQRFTPVVTQVINLIQTDVGRPLGHIVSNLTGYDRLVPDLRTVLDTLIPRELEVQTQAGRWYLLRLRPYRTLENVIEGAVITFTEVTDTKKAQAALRESESLRRLAAIVRDARDAIIVQDFEGRILSWNPAAEKLYGWSEAKALQMNIRELTPEDRRNKALAQLREFTRPDVAEPYHTQRIAKDGRILEVVLTATVLVNESGEAYAIATTERGLD